MAKTKKETLSEAILSNTIETDPEINKYLKAIGHVTMNTVKPMRMKSMPVFKTETERRRWEDEEVRRCSEGFNGMVGSMYQYYNYWPIKSVQGGRIMPEYRRAHNDFYALFESCMYGANDFYPDNTGKGLVLMGRRRWGKTYIMCNLAYNTAARNPHCEIGLTSKTEDDAVSFLSDKLKFGYSGLPQFLRLRSGISNAENVLAFGRKVKDKDGNTIKKGNTSIILARAPVPAALEGTGLKLFVVNEAGKTQKLEQLLNYILPACNGQDGLTRVGVPLLEGTAGDMDAVGEDYKNIWDNADAYDFVRYFAAGWSGFRVDELGNENIVEALKYILNEREKKMRISSKAYYDFIIQYPLTPDEAFIRGTGSRWDTVAINARLRDLEQSNDRRVRGKFEWVIPGESVRFIPDDRGSILMLEPVKNGSHYVAGADPTDGSADLKRSSKLVQYMRKVGNEFGRESEVGNGIVCEFYGKPEVIEEAYAQCAMMCVYYNKAKTLIESNRRGMISWFQAQGLLHLMKTKPQKAGVLKVVRTTTVVEYGFYRDDGIMNEQMDLVEQDIDYNINENYYPELLVDCLHYDPKDKKRKYDRVDAYMATLYHVRVLNRVNKKADDKSDEKLKKEFEAITYRTQRPQVTNISNGKII
jgi:hypothetical protein